LNFNATTEASEYTEIGAEVRTLEMLINQYGKKFEDDLVWFVSQAGSRLQNFGLCTRQLFTWVYKYCLLAYVLVFLPYFAYASIGEFILSNTYFVSNIVVGLFFIIGPLVGFGWLAFWLQLMGADNDEAAHSSEASRGVSIVQPSPQAYQFWKRYVVGSGVVITAITQIGWLLNYGVFVELHDTYLAWPNVVSLDSIGYLFHLAATAAGSFELPW